MKARRWWDGRFKIARVEDGKKRCGKLVKTEKRKGGGYVTNFMKTLGERGRKRSEWVIAVQSEILDKFERFSSDGVKISTHVLRHISVDIIKNDSQESLFYRAKRINGKPILERITTSWLQYFITRHNIVPRVFLGNYSFHRQG